MARKPFKSSHAWEKNCHLIWLVGMLPRSETIRFQKRQDEIPKKRKIPTQERVSWDGDNMKERDWGINVALVVFALPAFIISIVSLPVSRSGNKRLELPPDLANGMAPISLKNLQPSVPQLTASMVAATPTGC